VPETQAAIVEAGPAAAEADATPVGPRLAPAAARWLRSFGAFWWDFLVGDTPELLVGILAAIGVVALLVKASTLNSVAVGAFPALVVVLLAGSLYWARRANRRN